MAESVQNSEINAAEALDRLQGLIAEEMSSLFHSGKKDKAQALSNLLIDIGEKCHSLIDANFVSKVANVPILPNDMADGKPAPKIPDESFFLPPSALGNTLTLEVDPEILDTTKTDKEKASSSNKKDIVQRSRGRGRGRGRGRRRSTSITPEIMVKRQNIAPATWNTELQQQLSMAFRFALQHDDENSFEDKDLEALPCFIKDFSRELRSSPACEGFRRMGSTLPGLVATLQVAGYSTVGELMDALASESQDAAETYLALHEPSTRRGKVIGVVDAFTNTVHPLIDVVLAEAGRKAKATSLKRIQSQKLSDEEITLQQWEEAQAIMRLPPSIKANREPYKHGEWRKLAFAPRPYVRLNAYYIVEEASREVIERKLKTKKHGGCDGGHCTNREDLGTYSLEAGSFQTNCSCLSRNTECDDRCMCAETECLNRFVSKRQTVRLGEDVEEINSWGMDCYTRRNIQDVVLESQAYGPYKMPNFSSILSKDSFGTRNECMPIRAATAAGQHAAVAADSPTTDKNNDSFSPVGEKSLLLKDNINSTDSITTPGSIKETLNNSPISGNRYILASPTGAPIPIGVATEPTKPSEKKKHRAAVEHLVSYWIERVLIPAINRQGENGWDLKNALKDVLLRGESSGDEASKLAATSVLDRLDDVGYNYFRIHPKGVGLVCKRPGGIPRLTFVEEYFGEIHQPWRWFELQDAVKKITGDELPDFYNIVLERPRDDPDGYDVLFVDAAAKGAFASRMSHSCTPNCQAVVMACGGRLTIALYTLRHVYEGEELTFDYSSVTESEKEFREAICLCGTHMCRGSYLYFTGSRAFMQVLNERHNMLQRQVMLARAGSEPLTDADKERIRRHGLGESSLGSVSRGDRVPEWLEKWTSLVCEYLELEEACLKQELLEKDSLGIYTEATAAAEAKGVVANRLQNVVITLDKVRMFLSQPGQPQSPCIRILNDQEIVEHLWSGFKSVAKKTLRYVSGALVGGAAARRIASADNSSKLEDAIAMVHDTMPPSLIKICDVIFKQASNPEEARKYLIELSNVIRDVDIEIGGGLTAAADILILYANTHHWITYERGYSSVTSPAVPINLTDLFLNREATQAAEPIVNAGMDSEERRQKEAELEKAAQTAAAALARQHKKNPALRKTYRPLYVWGQLSGWFKQTVNDPTASLSAERRGTLSLPDIDSCFSGKGRYGAKERSDLIEHLSRRPDAMWKAGTLWSFKNESKVYGSPMLDSAWAEAIGEGEDPLPATIAKLKEAKTPFSMDIPLKSSRSRISRGRGRGKSKRRASEAEMEDIDILLASLP